MRMHALFLVPLSRLRPRRAVAVGLLAIAAAGCGAGDAEFVALQRVQLRELADEAAAGPEAEELVSYRRLDVPAELGRRWKVDGVKASVRISDAPEDGGRRPRLRLESSAKTRRLRVRGPFHPQRFNQIVLRVLSERDVSVNARFMKDGRPFVGTERGVTLARTRAETVLVLPVPKARRKVERVEELQLAFGSGGGAIVLWSIELVHRPLATWLPDVDEPGLVRVGEEHRRSFGLADHTPVEGEFYAPRKGVLRFDYATPELARMPGASPVLRVELTSPGARWEQDFPMEADLLQPVQWHSAALPLARFEGDEVRVRLSLSGYGEAEGLCAVGPPVVVAEQRDAPTVLLVTSDTHRADHVAAAEGAVELRTPTLDALAERGVMFEQCFSTTNITNPSHVAIMTGVSMRDSGVVDNLHPLGSGAQTLAEIFRDAGFVTFGAVSAVHLAPGPSGLGQGFDRFSAPDDAKRIGAATLAPLGDWLAEARGRPLFVWLHLFDAHAPYEPPEPFDRMYYEGDPFDPELEPSDDLLPEQVPPWLDGLRDTSFPPLQYRAEITYLDDQLGQVLAMPRMRDAWVAVTGDHGELLGERRLFWQHGHLYPSVLHVPLILAGPNVPRGLRTATAVQNVDLGRTLLELVGLGEAEFEGQDLMQALDAGAADEAPRFCLSQRFTSASVSQGGWHCLLHLKGHVLGRLGSLGKAERHAVELYHYAEDPRCERDLAAVETERARAMRSLLVAWLEAARDRGWAQAANMDPELAEKLRALGYTGEVEQGAEGALFDADCACEACAKFR